MNTRGFTLLETIMVTSLFTLLTMVLSNTIITLYRTNAYTLAQAYEVNFARRGVEFLVRDMREMTFADDGTYPLVSMGTSSISFFSDIDRDNSVELVRYALASTTLKKYVYNATGTPPTYSTTTPSEVTTISEYVRNIEQATSTFRYYIDGGLRATATSTVTDIRYIEAYLIVNVDPIRTPGQFTLKSTAAPRNLKVSF